MPKYQTVTPVSPNITLLAFSKRLLIKLKSVKIATSSTELLGCMQIMSREKTQLTAVDIFSTGQTTGKIWAPKYYIFPIHDLPHRSPKKISFSQYVNNVGTPLFRSMCQAKNTDTNPLNQLGVSQNSSPLWSNFTADKHIWHPSWARM